MTARGPVPGSEGTLFRGYAPFVALVALVLAMALFAPTIAPERDVVTRSQSPAPAEGGAGAHAQRPALTGTDAP